VATIDRIEPAYQPWSPSTAGFPATDQAREQYVGKHRRPGARGFNLLRMFHVGRHRRR
jgi:hypothetical protein